MKKLTTLPLILFALLLITQSCKKQSQDQKETIISPVQSINAIVSANNPYILNVTDLGNVSISKQAAHFTISQTETDTKDGILVYKYVPKNDYNGADEVELLSSKTSYSGGNGCNGGGGHITTYNKNIVIKFTVAK